MICPQIWYDLLYSWQSIHQFSYKYSHLHQSYSNFEFSEAAILKIQNGGRHRSQITCLYFVYDSNNKKLSIHQISCFYDYLNNLATNRSTIYTMEGAPPYAGLWPALSGHQILTSLIASSYPVRDLCYNPPIHPSTYINPHYNT